MKAMIRAIQNWIIGLILFVGLPVIGWGIFDIRGFFENSARLVYVILFLLMQSIIVVLIPNIGHNRNLEKDTDLSQRVALLLLQIIPLALVILAPLSDRQNFAVFQDTQLLRFIGLILFLSGFALMHWAEATLGKQFSVQVTVQKDHQLITSGPFKYLRHPRYLGIIMFTSGIALTFRTWLGLVLVAALLLVLLWRINEEESLMQVEFGEEWKTYAQKTWRLIPFVY